MGIGIRLFMGILFGLVWAFTLWNIDDRERSEEDAPEQPRYRAYLPNMILPVFVLMIGPFVFLVDGGGQAFEIMLTILVNVFSHICVYYLLLILFLPLLRRYVSARICAALWLLPNYLYLFAQKSYELPAPAFVFYLPDGMIYGVAAVWAAGVVGVLGWKIFSHFRFRRHILQYAREVEDSAVLDIWRKEQRRAGYHKKQYALVRSPEVSTPLTIGFFRGTIRVVLPERSYTPEELTLIFRHELVHIGREDAATKFFLVFCTAMCWFNPLMWWAMRKSAEDLELSCDETVLLSADGKTRKQYAELILTTAGDERGFTTCLSATARSLRYRLKHIVTPRKRTAGFLLAGGVFCLLVATCGYITVAYETVPGTEAIFGGNDLSGYEVKSAYWERQGEIAYCEVTDEQALRDYLAELEFHKVSGHYTFDTGARCFGMTYYSPEGRTWFDLTDEGLRIYRPTTDRVREFTYSCRDVDWDYLESLMVPK